MKWERYREKTYRAGNWQISYHNYKSRCGNRHQGWTAEIINQHRTQRTFRTLKEAKAYAEAQMEQMAM